MLVRYIVTGVTDEMYFYIGVIAKYVLLYVTYQGKMHKNRTSNGTKSLRALDGHKIAKI